MYSIILLAFFVGNGITLTFGSNGTVDPDCVSKGLSGSCDLYDCFEERFTCGPDGYMKKFGCYYCHRFENHIDQFTDEGLQFLIRSRQCLTQGLLSYYRRDELTCHELEQAAVGMISDCYIQSGICDVFEANVNAFLTVFQLQEARSEKLRQELGEVANACGGRVLEIFSDMFRSE